MHERLFFACVLSALLLQLALPPNSYRRLLSSAHTHQPVLSAQYVFQHYENPF